ncbi:hypothetical protein TWF173_004639 [Orbilia oligospora]|nr:hypothetical protein TWF173_004639 [Orbilia oligospora]
MVPIARPSHQETTQTKIWPGKILHQESNSVGTPPSRRESLKAENQAKTGPKPNGHTAPKDYPKQRGDRERKERAKPGEDRELKEYPQLQEHARRKDYPKQKEQAKSKDSKERENLNYGKDEKKGKNEKEARRDKKSKINNHTVVCRPHLLPQKQPEMSKPEDEASEAKEQFWMAIAMSYQKALSAAVYLEYGGDIGVSKPPLRRPEPQVPPSPRSVASSSSPTRESKLQRGSGSSVETYFKSVLARHNLIVWLGLLARVKLWCPKRVNAQSVTPVSPSPHTSARYE